MKFQLHFALCWVVLCNQVAQAKTLNQCDTQKFIQSIVEKPSTAPFSMRFENHELEPLSGEILKNLKDHKKGHYVIDLDDNVYYSQKPIVLRDDGIIVVNHPLNQGESIVLKQSGDLRLNAKSNKTEFIQKHGWELDADDPLTQKLYSKIEATSKKHGIDIKINPLKEKKLQINRVTRCADLLTQSRRKKNIVLGQIASALTVTTSARIIDMVEKGHFLTEEEKKLFAADLISVTVGGVIGANMDWHLLKKSYSLPVHVAARTGVATGNILWKSPLYEAFGHDGKEIGTYDVGYTVGRSISKRYVDRLIVNHLPYLFYNYCLTHHSAYAIWGLRASQFGDQTLWAYLYLLGRDKNKNTVACSGLTGEPYLECLKYSEEDRKKMELEKSTTPVQP